MNKLLRNTLRTIREAGGEIIAVRHGGKHTRVEYRSVRGVTRFATVHKGSISSSRRAERGLRSDLRRDKAPRGICA